jgi:hypothetical protein
MVFLTVFGFVAVALASGPSERFEALAADIREAITLAGLTMKSAAIEMGLGADGSQLARELNGTGHLSARRLADMPDAFWSWLAIKQLQRVGLPAEVKLAQQLAERVK